MSSLATWCPPPCPPAQQHGTACGVAAVEELSVVQWELHIVYSSPQCAMAAL